MEMTSEHVAFSEYESCGRLFDRVVHSAENIGELRIRGYIMCAMAVVFKRWKTHFSMMFRYETNC